MVYLTTVTSLKNCLNKTPKNNSSSCNSSFCEKNPSCGNIAQDGKQCSLSNNSEARTKGTFLAKRTSFTKESVFTNETIFCADIGTSSLKAALIDKNGAVFAFSQQTFDTSVERTKLVSQQWLSALCAAANDFGEKIKTVKGICISGNGPTIVSDDGTTLLWNDAVTQDHNGASPDTTGKSATQAALTQPEKSETKKSSSTTAENATEASCKKTKSLFIPRLLAFRQKFPLQWNNATFIFSGPEYLMYLLTGKAVTILPEQRFEAAYWNNAELSRMGFAPAEQKKLPPFVAPAFNLGKTTKKITAQLNLTSPVPVFCGAPDFVAALIGTNTLKPGKICDRAGSSEGINFCTEHILDHPKIRMLPSVISGLWNASVLFPDSGRLFSEYKNKIENERKKSISYKNLVEECLADKTSEGYKIMQSLAEKTKDAFEILDGALRCYAAHSATITADDKTSQDIGATHIPSSITITGGQAKSEQWVQMKADICCKNFELCSIADSELLGDAVLGFTGLGTYKTIQEAADAIIKTGKVFKPTGGNKNENI